MRKNKLKLIILSLLLFGLVACGNTEDDKVETDSSIKNETVTDYSKIEYEQVKVEVTDEEINDEINWLIKNNPKPLETDRTIVEDGDIITVKFTAGPSEGGDESLAIIEPVEEVIYTSNKESYIEGFIDNCIGAELNKEITFNITFNESAGDTSLVGQVIAYKLTVTDIKESGVYESHEEIAIDFGYESLENLQKLIKENLEQQKLADVEFQTQHNALKAYAEYVGLEIDKVKIEEFYNSEMQLEQQYAESVGMSLEQSVQEYYGMSLVDYENYLRESCEAQITYEIVTDDIIAKEKLTVEELNKDEEVQKLAGGYGVSIDELKLNMNEEMLNESVLRNHALHLLMDNAIGK